MPFPEKLEIGLDTYVRETCNDGFVYRVEFRRYPHVTIHNVKDDQYWWWLNHGEFHISYGHGELHEYRKGDPDPFLDTRGRRATNRGLHKQEADDLAKKFWDTIRGL